MRIARVITKTFGFSNFGSVLPALPVFPFHSDHIFEISTHHGTHIPRRRTRSTNLACAGMNSWTSYHVNDFFASRYARGLKVAYFLLEFVFLV
jgi:hypothetical protein